MLFQEDVQPFSPIQGLRRGQVLREEILQSPSVQSMEALEVGKEKPGGLSSVM